MATGAFENGKRWAKADKSNNVTSPEFALTAQMTPPEQDDTYNYAILILLYTLQGIPIGLSASIPFLIQQKVAKIATAAAAASGKKNDEKTTHDLSEKKFKFLFGLKTAFRDKPSETNFWSLFSLDGSTARLFVYSVFLGFYYVIVVCVLCVVCVVVFCHVIYLT